MSDVPSRVRGGVRDDEDGTFSAIFEASYPDRDPELWSKGGFATKEEAIEEMKKRAPRIAAWLGGKIETIQ